MRIHDIAQLRLANQQITLHASKTPVELVTALGAVQAQDYRSALWAIGLRLPAITEADIEQAIAGRTIVRTWPMRGTLHFVPAADVRWMLALLTPRVIAGAAYRRRQLELDDATIAHSRDLFVNALQGGKQLTRKAMLALLEQAGIATTGQRGIHILAQLAQEGLLCFATPQKRQPTFALLDEWVPAAGSVGHDEALAELARRYFAGHGPATVQDFMWWAGLTAADAKAAVQMARDQLAQETVDGTPYWMSRTLPTVPDVSPAVHLLPGFDEYILGYKDRSAALDAQAIQRIISGGMFLPTILADGRVVGTWKHVLKKNSVSVVEDLFAPLTEAESRAFQAAADGYRRFSGTMASTSNRSERDAPMLGP